MKQLAFKPGRRQDCLFSYATMFALAALLLITPVSRGGSIFDDDYTPPKRAEPAPEQPAPATPDTPAVPPPVNPTQPATHPPDAPVPAPADNTAHRGLPDKTSRVKCRTLFEEIYAKELKDHSPAARRKLAQTLLDEAAKNVEGSPDRYMLLIGAVQAAEEGQSLRICFTAAKLLASGYAVDELATKANAAAKAFAGPQSPTLASMSNIEALLSLADQLVAEDAFVTLSQVETALQRAAGTISDPDLKKEVAEQIREATALREAKEKVSPAQVKLRQTPEDPAANLAVGSYLCFQLGKWEKGLPLLAKSSDARLKDLATAELAGTADVDAKSKLADNWLATAAKLPAPDRPKAMQHAADLYGSAEVGLTGLQKLAIEKRLAQIPPPSRPRRVNLLDRFDPATSVVAGTWRMEDGSLACEASTYARVDFGYAPPAEYDFRVSFTVVHEVDLIELTCYGNGHPFAFNIGSGPNKVAGFERVNGMGVLDNKASKHKDHWFVDGQHYTCVVKVRRGEVQAYLEGQLVSDLKTDYSNLSLYDGFKLSRDDVIGVGSLANVVRFDGIEVVEVSGEGKLVGGK